MTEPVNFLPTDSLSAICRCNLDTCREVTQLTLDCAGRLEKIGLAYARKTVIKGLAVAEEPGEDEVVQAAVPELGDWLGMQREIGDTLVDTSRNLFRVMADYGARLNRTLASTAVSYGPRSDG